MAVTDHFYVPQTILIVTKIINTLHISWPEVKSTQITSKILSLKYWSKFKDLMNFIDSESRICLSVEVNKILFCLKVPLVSVRLFVANRLINAIKAEYKLARNF